MEIEKKKKKSWNKIDRSAVFAFGGSNKVLLNKAWRKPRNVNSLVCCHSWDDYILGILLIKKKNLFFVISLFFKTSPFFGIRNYNKIFNKKQTK